MLDPSRDERLLHSLSTTSFLFVDDDIVPVDLLQPTRARTGWSNVVAGPCCNPTRPHEREPGVGVYLSLESWPVASPI